MFKTTLVGNTGGYVTYKQIETEKGKRDQLQFTVFPKDKGKKTPVFCVWTSKDLSEVSKYLMIDNTKEDAKSPYCSRLLAVDGRISIQDKYQELQVYDKDEDGDIVELVDEDGDSLTAGVMAPSIVVFIDSIEFLDKTPGKVDKDKKNKKVTASDLASRYKKKAKDIAKKEDKVAEDTTEDDITEDEKVSAKSTKKKATRKTKKTKESEEILDDTLSDEEIMKALQG